ncbi:MAG: methylated-DNA--[protein]-cysteine S-methyltransferase [Bacteroidota bacterium]
MEQHSTYKTIEQAIQFLMANQYEQPSLEEVASYVHMSKYHFQRLFKQWAGVSPKEFLQFLTIERSKQALREGQSTLDAALQAGLSGTGRLHDLFVKIEACTPGEFKNQGKGLTIYFEQIHTPFGPAVLSETPKGINMLSFFTNFSEEESLIKEEFPYATLQRGLGTNGHLVQKYFQDWEVPTQKIQLALKGTPFQIQVWKGLLQIPAAQFLSYQDIAQIIHNPKAVRAVGTAIGKNPIAYLIPCHRVIRNSGVLGNYRWNPDRKRMINGYEAIHL